MLDCEGFAFKIDRVPFYADDLTTAQTVECAKYDGKLDMLIDGAYLAAGVMSLIDEDEVVEDSTQIPSADSRRRKEEKMKQYGIAPTM